MRVAHGLVGVTTFQTPGTNESLPTIEYFYLKVANSNWGIVVKLIVEPGPSSKQAVMRYFLH